MEQIFDQQSELLPGHSSPLGATVFPGGVNFCIFSKNCTAMELLLFDDADSPLPSRVIQLDPERNRTFYYWHVFVIGIKSGQLYAYRAHGPFAPERGHRFDGTKVLLDPYARAVSVSGGYDRDAALHPGDNCAHAMRSVAVDTSTYDWGGDTHLHHAYAGTTIYELHVGGFTRNANSGIASQKRGTYAGLIEKIPYLKELGVTAVELLPVQQFDEQDAPQNVIAAHKNYWGYSPIAFFAPHSGYSSKRDPLGAVNEFRDMIKAFHRAEIEVILDVVFNHSAEGNHNGPTLSFRGLENRAYYIIGDDPRFYHNYSGCGNTLNANHSIVRRMILDCLRYWAAEMHVDGFRFDLASVMARDEWGQPLKSPPILWEIESDPVLADIKIIAEAWDAVGLYQVGSFVGHRWAEWNGQFRDDVRRFVKGDPGTVERLAARIAGSPDLYPQPQRSINFITCHDGFTLNDLVSYNDKHNEINGEDNRDGTDANYSWNCGVEGPTSNRAIEQLRQQQIKNLLTILLISQGTPMLWMGDEVRRSQQGNNNAYCQDNTLSWFDWEGLANNGDLLQFVQGVIRLTQTHPIFLDDQFWVNPPEGVEPRLTWHGVRLGEPDWSAESHSLAFTLGNSEDADHFHVMINAYWEPLNFELAPVQWCRVLDTSLAPPNDFCGFETAPQVRGGYYRVQGRSVVILLSRDEGQ